MDKFVLHVINYLVVLSSQCQIAIFTSHGAHVNCAIIAMLYTHLIWKSAVKHDGGDKCVIVYLA